MTAPPTSAPLSVRQWQRWLDTRDVDALNDWGASARPGLLATPKDVQACRPFMFEAYEAGWDEGVQAWCTVLKGCSSQEQTSLMVDDRRGVVLELAIHVAKRGDVGMLAMVLPGLKSFSEHEAILLRASRSGQHETMQYMWDRMGMSSRLYMLSALYHDPTQPEIPTTWWHDLPATVWAEHAAGYIRRDVRWVDTVYRHISPDAQHEVRAKVKQMGLDIPSAVADDLHAALPHPAPAAPRMRL